MSDLDAIRDVARAVSAEIVRTELASGYRVRRPADPGGTYIVPAFRYLLVASNLGLVEVRQ